MSPAPQHEEIPGQISGYWIDRDHTAPPQPRHQFTGAVLPRLGETTLVDFVCLDLVLVDAGPRFVWLPLSEAGRYAYAHSLGLMYEEPWRLVVFGDDATIREYDASYDELLPAARIAYYYGREAEVRARQDYPAVQLRLRLRAG